MRKKSIPSEQHGFTTKTATPQQKSFYHTWNLMRERCSNENLPKYFLYGGRGIKVCDRWMKFTNFRNDMWGTHKLGLSLDRIDSNKDYSPDNCRWATVEQQMRNRRTNRKITYKGKTMCLSEWAEEYNINEITIAGRIKRGLSIGEALETPLAHHGKLRHFLEWEKIFDAEYGKSLDTQLNGIIAESVLHGNLKPHSSDVSYLRKKLRSIISTHYSKHLEK